MRSFPIVMTVTGYYAPLTIGMIRMSNIKMPASDKREAGLCATPDNSVNIESPKRQFQNNFCDVAVFRRERRRRQDKPALLHQRQATEKIWYYDLSDIKVLKRSSFTGDKFKKCFEPLPTRGESERSWIVNREQIEASNYGLKAVNPNAKSEEDTRAPEELLDFIEAKGKEVSDALA